MVNIFFVICFLATNIMCKYSVNGNYYCNCKTIQCPTAIELFKKEIHTVQQNVRNISSHMQMYSVTMCKSTVENDVIWDRHPKLKLLPKDCGFIDPSRVVDGKIAGLTEFPWMALISHRNGSRLQFKCSGTLINKMYVLTSAYCIDGRDIAGVRIGDHDPQSTTDCEGASPFITCTFVQDIGVDKIIVHKEYRGLPEFKNDIGLIRLHEAVNFKKRNVGFICLTIIAKVRNHDVGNERGLVTGWSIDSGRMIGRMRKRLVKVTPQLECRAFFNSSMSEVKDQAKNKICAGVIGKDSCSEHLGEPLMVRGEHNKKERYIHRGIRSQGPAPCAAGDFGVYTDVAPYMKWILDNIEP